MNTLDHVGIAVPSIDEALPLWERLVGTPAWGREIVDSQGVDIVFLGDGPGKIELLAPTRADSPITRFLEKRGAGLHHLCFSVRDLPAALATWIAEGHQPIDREPRLGAAGHRVAFLHPRDTAGVLIELLEKPDSSG